MDQILLQLIRPDPILGGTGRATWHRLLAQHGTKEVDEIRADCILKGNGFTGGHDDRRWAKGSNFDHATDATGRPEVSLRLSPRTGRVPGPPGPHQRGRRTPALLDRQRRSLEACCPSYIRIYPPAHQSHSLCQCDRVGSSSHSPHLLFRPPLAFDTRANSARASSLSVPHRPQQGPKRR